MNMVGISKKLKYICGLIALCLAISLLLFVLTACASDNADKALTLDNYSKYIRVSCGGTSGISNRYTTRVDIKKIEDCDLQNVEIKYIFTAPDFEKTVTASLGNLKTAYLNMIEFNYGEPHTSLFPPSSEISIEVLEISGKVNIQENNDTIHFVIGIAVIIIAIGATIFHYVWLSIKLSRVCVGMTLSEVIKVLGEPDVTETVGDVTTANWKTSLGRGWRRIYCTLTFKNNIVISKIEQGWFFE